jgi:alkanesulfonate monooxygenase SsuD/methylene tetrahydromethanopterin reductase-like flavin-dependent oxidoreductase (luciferase family)
LGSLRFGLSLANFGDFADARLVADLARVAEGAGWEALLVWDHLAFTWGPPSGDPWTLVTAAAMATTRLLVGTDVAVVARERPLAFANRIATIDRLSGGRVVLGAGVGGAADEYRKAGEPVEMRERAALTDEVLAVVRGLLGGEEVTHRGPSLAVDGVTLAPLPEQAPVPVWIGGDSRGAMRRAARHDGWIPYAIGQDGVPEMTPDDLRARVAAIHAMREEAGLDDVPFVVGWHGETPLPGGLEADRDGGAEGDGGAAGAVEAAAIVRPWAEAGATWWLECLHGFRGSTAWIMERVAAGPPRI